MKYQDPELQAEYERGKRQAQEIWGEFFSTPERVSGVIESFRKGRDQCLRTANNPSCNPEYRRDCAKQAAHCTGWLDAWNK
jgi:hypothetical protein